MEGTAGKVGRNSTRSVPLIMPRLNLLILTIIMAAIIVHGSLYPYDFHITQGNTGPWQALLTSWDRPPSGFGDLVANILLYIPFGFFGAMSMRLRLMMRLILIVLAGFGLCLAVELAQFYDQGRVTNMSDIYLNTFGTMLGAAAASVLDDTRHIPFLRSISKSPVPAMLIAALLGYHLFPYVPTIDLHKYWQSLKPVFLTPEIAPYPVFHYFALWVTASYLVAAIVPKHARAAAALFAAFVFASKIAIVNLVVTAAEVLGAALAVIGAMAFPKHQRGAAVAVALVLGMMIILDRLEPFAFHSTAARFGWMPFRSFMGGSLSVNIQSFAEKVFLYGSWVWLLREAGLHLRYAAAVTAFLLFATSYAEVYLPGRSAEITDAVISILVAIIIGILEAWSSEPCHTGPGVRLGRDISPERRA